MDKQPLTWTPTAAEVRNIVTEMRPLLEAEARRAERDLGVQPRR